MSKKPAKQSDYVPSLDNAMAAILAAVPEATFGIHADGLLISAPNSKDVKLFNADTASADDVAAAVAALAKD